MINRICISINNRCNLRCKYCHFQEKGFIQKAEMNVFEILDNVKTYAGNNEFKIGFVGNGEPFLDWDLLRQYIAYISDCDNISAYTITNGTVGLTEDDWHFLELNRVNVGFSLDGFKAIHNLYRNESYDDVMRNVEVYRNVTGHYPTFNATVGKESLKHEDAVIEYFTMFGTRVTFSRMIGRYGISLEEYKDFLNKAENKLNVRRGGNDCTMYGGHCGAGINNFFFANGYVYLCGNCIDLPPVALSGTCFTDLEKTKLMFDRNSCYKESICE